MEHASTIAKLRTRKRANSVAFACNIEQNITAKDIEPQPSSSTANDHRVSIINQDSSGVFPVS